jgi:hypothetical protein
MVICPENMVNYTDDSTQAFKRKGINIQPKRPNDRKCNLKVLNYDLDRILNKLPVLESTTFIFVALHLVKNKIFP